MKPTPSEDILIIRILDALSDSGKTALGISNFIKAKHYRVETAYEIKKVIHKYLINEKVIFEPLFELFRLKKKEGIIDRGAERSNSLHSKRDITSTVKSFVNNNINSNFEIELPKNVLFLNELYLRRAKLISFPYEERISKYKLEIIETNSEINGIKPLAIEELSKLPDLDRTQVIIKLMPVLKSEIQKITFPKGSISKEHLLTKTDHPQAPEIENNVAEKLVEQLKEPIMSEVDSPALKNEPDYLSKENLLNVTKDEVVNDTSQEFIKVENVIKIIIEEKIRLGKLDGNLLAENILFRIKKGKWD